MRTLFAILLLACVAPALAAPGADTCGGPDPADLPEVIHEFRRVMWYDSMDEFQARATALHDSIMADPGSSPVHRALAAQCLLDAGEWRQRWRDPQHRVLAYRILGQVQEALPPCHPEIARSMLWLSRIENIGFDSPERADSLLQIAERIQSDFYGPTSPEVGFVLTYRVEPMVNMGLEREAMELSERAVRYTATATAEQAFWPYRAYGSLAACYGRRGEYGHEVYLRRRQMALISRDLPGMRFTIAAGTTHLGNALWGLGDIAGAQDAFLRVIEVAATFDAGPFDQDYVPMQLLGLMRVRMGDWVYARQLLEECLRDIERLALPAAYRAPSLLGLSEIAYLEGRAAEAAALLDSARDVLGQDPRRDLSQLEDLEQFAAGLLALDHPAEVPALVAEMRSMADSLMVSPRAPSRARFALLEAAALRKLGDSAGATRVLRTAFAVEPDSTLDARDVRNELRGALGDLLDDQGEVEGRGWILDYLTESRALDREAIRKLPERQAILRSGLRAPRLHRLLPSRGVDAEGSAAQARELLDQLVRSRRFILDELAWHRRASWHRAMERAPEEVEAWRLAGSRLRSFDAADTEGRDPESLRRQRLVLLQELLDREARLVHAGAVDAVVDSAREVGLEDVTVALGDSSVLVSYIRLPELATGGSGDPTAFAYHALVHGPSRTRTRILRLGPASLIDSLAAEWKRVAGPRSVETAAGAAGRRLAEQVWDPVHAILADVRIVQIVLDGALALVNFDALPAADGRYPGEAGVALHVVGAERDLVRGGAPQRKAMPRAALIVAAPDFGAGNAGLSSDVDARGAPAEPVYRGTAGSCAEFRTRSFVELESARHEGRDVARSLRAESTALKPVLVEGAEASEACVKRIAAEAGALHFATHGYVVDSRCAGGDESLRRTRGWGASNAPLLLDNPLTRCGLALAGANRRAEAGPDEDDGLLTGDEVAALDLSGVEFVVLSACNTGVGEVLDGEGVLGLQRAFKIAGAGPVVMSLWPVEDQVARQWMRHFYAARLTPGVTTAEATRRASLAMLAERRRLGLSTRPSSWAPFVSVGVER